MNKLEGAKNFIQAADYIYEDYIVDMLDEDFTMYDEKELKIKINSYAEQCAKICEYYLKALILPNMKSPNFNVNSDEEMDYLANNKNGLRKYNHIFKKIINSEDFDENIKKNIEYYLLNYLPHFNEKRKDLSEELSKRLTCAHKDIPVNYEFKNFANLFTNVNGELDEKLNKIVGENGLISENSDVYQKSRYAMIKDYTADLSFLYVYCEAIRDSLIEKFKNCIEIIGTKKHIFIDCDSFIDVIFYDGNIEKFYFNKEYKLYRLEDLGNKRVAYFGKLNLNRFKNDIIDKIIFIEDGNIRQLTLNKKTGKYYFANPDRIIYKDDQKEVNKILKKD